LKIGFDVDDVLCDLLTPWLASYNEEFDTNWTPDQLTQWEIWLDLGGREADVYRHLRASLYKVAQPFFGALAVVEAVRAMGHEVVFLTSCPDAWHYHAKLEWLARYGFTRSDLEVIPFGSAFALKKKNEYFTDLLLDDGVQNVEGRVGGILLSRPHNLAAQFTGRRAESLMEFANHLWALPAVA